MPNSIIKSFADKTGKSIQDIENYWKKAEEIVKKDYPDVKSDSEKYYQIIVAIVKKMSGINEEESSGPTITTTSVGNSSSVGGSANYAKYLHLVTRYGKAKKRKKKKGEHQKE